MLLELCGIIIINVNINIHSPFNLLEGDIDLLLDKFYQENQGHISSSLYASVNKPTTALDGTGASVCTSK